MGKMKVVGGSLNVRKEPSLDAQVIHVLEDGEVIKPASEKDEWCAWGSGYVMAKWLEPAEDAVSDQAKESEQIVAAAEEIKDAAKELKEAARSAKKSTASKKTQSKKK